MAKLTDEQIAEIRRRYVKGHRFRPAPEGCSAAELAKEFSTAPSHITAIVRGEVR